MRDFDDEDLAALTESERAQLQALENDEAVSQSDLQELANGGDDDEVNPGQESGTQQAADAGADAAAAQTGSQSQQTDQAAEQSKAEARPAQHQPIYTAQAPDDIGAQLAKVNADRVALFKQYNEGEIDGDEYLAKSTELETARDGLLKDQIKAQVSSEMTEQQATRAWQNTVADFFANSKSAGFDYADPANQAAKDYLNTRVKAMAELHDDSPEGWKALLDEAHSLTAAKFKIQTKPAQQQNQQAQQTQQVAKTPAQSRQPDLSKVPPTLRQAPPAADASVSGDEFSHLGGLDGIALEKAVAKLTPEQQQRWANS